ncbi:hypothetical protein ACHAW6_009419 [Cyclotella cf. meneghiniana]
MTNIDLIPEFESRQLPSKSFFTDNAKVLQATFEMEHEANAETKKNESMDEKLVEAQQLADRERQALVKRSIAEEEKELSENTRLVAWFEMILNQSSQLVDPLADISARSLSKIVWSDKKLVSVDVSNMQLSDVSGAYLCRALRNSTSLKKLELGGNRFASQCCMQLAESLLANENSNLASLGLDSNPLSAGEDSKESIALLARAIGKNAGLMSLSLWRCGIGIEGGRAFAEAIVSGISRLISLEVGYNHFDDVDIAAISKQLVRCTRHAVQTCHDA